MLATGDASLIWEGHKAGREIGYCHLEKLHNLEALPADRLHGLLLSRSRCAAAPPAGRARSRSSTSDPRAAALYRDTSAMPYAALPAVDPVESGS